MKKLTFVVSILAFIVAPALGQNQPAAQATAKIGYIYALEQDVPTVILSQAIKTPTGKGLFIDVSVECGLVTDTWVQSKKGNKNTATAEASVVVWVTVDGAPHYAEPGHVVFCRRTQELTATFSGLLSLCVDPATGIIDPACFEFLQPEEIGLLLDTMSANSFNFYYGLETSGVHTVEVWAQIGTTTSVSGLDQEAHFAQAEALIGKGSVTINLVRLIKDEDVVDLP
ncbi:MAG: hypothetical protein O6826_01530 [Acidobacteria bacterium]|nr:hypothetical protein [Acidobacteriota bacterium]MCZ6768936.1 hypothetical protein [Acidobacteriota bacterium]MCZ6877596.1 hypothetical protein [Acidobacteriota bacterium]